MMKTVKLYKLLLAFLILISFSFSQITGLSGWDIWIDAGHSRNENMGIYNYAEAWKNVRVALNIEDLLLTLTDIDTVGMTRRDDQVYVGLTERCTMANNWGAAWFHSLHSDAGGSTSNSTLLLWGQRSNGTPDPPVGGEAMSDIMIDLLTRGMRTYTVFGSIGDCSFYGCSGSGPYLAVNRQTNMPSELSEAGFHTNPRQNQLNMNAEWKRLEAWTFFWSILKYHDIARPAVGIAAGIVSNLESGQAINNATVTLDGQSYTTDSYDSLFYQYSNNPGQLRNGFYYFEGLPDSTLELVVTADGFNCDTQMVAIIDTFFTFRDVQLVSNIPPWVVESTPAAGDTAYPAWDYIIIDFSRPMDRNRVENAFSIVPHTTGSFAWSGDNKRIVFVPDLLIFNTDYTVTIADSATDVYGHNLDGDGDGNPGGDYTLSFRTSGSDILAPVIDDIYPPISANQIELRPIINIVYNEIVGPADQLDSYFTLERFIDHSLIDHTFVNYTVNNRTVVSLFPDQKFTPEEVYITNIAPGIHDTHDNSTTVTSAYSFRTAATDIEVRTIDPMESNITSNWWQPGQSGTKAGQVADSTNMTVNTNIVNHLTGSTAGMEIKYGWDINASNWILREYLSGGSPRNVIFNTGYTLQVYIFGDGSGNEFRFAIDEGTSTSWPGHEVSQWITVDWYGWKLVEWNLSDPGQVGSWIGNGVLDGARYRFDSIQLTYTPGCPAFGRFIFDDLRLVTPVSVAIDPDITGLPQNYRLEQNYPNPFNPYTTISYYLPTNRDITLVVYDVKGQYVRTLISGFESAGIHAVIWDGKDQHGNAVASGVYFYRLSSGDLSQSRRMIYMK